MKLHHLLIGVLVALTSCSSKSEFHSTSFAENIIYMFADQTEDTIHVIYTDPWTLTSDNPWLKPEVTSGKLSSQMYNLETRAIAIKAQPNTTGQTRLAVLTLRGDDVAQMPVYQIPYLNILTPDPVVTGETEADRKADYTLTLADSIEQTIIRFHVYGDATLSSNAEWLVPDSTEFTPGLHAVGVRTGRNRTGSMRSGVLMLTSNGASTPINIRQN